MSGKKMQSQKYNANILKNIAFKLVGYFYINKNLITLVKKEFKLGEIIFIIFMN
jgi:hypothetical protein